MLVTNHVHVSKLVMIYEKPSGRHSRMKCGGPEPIPDMTSSFSDPFQIAMYRRNVFTLSNV
jgi:hypothetical protein